jgi:3-hydroxyisobutyrate dehydrogenase-like beta-hydroxyacid dehydrogenase
MGEGMAICLVRARLAVTVREMRIGPLQRLMKHGAATCASDAGLGRQADIVCVCVPDEDQVNGVLFGHDGDPGVLAGLHAGGIVAVHSTVSPAFMRRLGAEAARRDIGVLDAPVSGGPWDAIEGRLIFMVGGDEVTAARARVVLEPMAAKVHHVGPLGSGIVAKIINNALTIANLAAMRETLRLACALGLPEPAVLGIVSEASGGSWASAHWDQILQLDSAATGSQAGPVSQIARDLHLAAGLASDTGTWLPVLSSVREQILPSLQAHGLAGDR